MKQIENEEQYQKAVEWLPKMAEELEHPLLQGEERDKKNRVYDAVSEEVQRYNHERMLKNNSYYPEEPQQEEEELDWL